MGSIRTAGLCACCALLLIGAAACAGTPETLGAATTPKACAPVPENIDSVLAAKIDAAVDSAAARGFAGGVTVIRDGTIVYDRVAGSASLTEDIPVTQSTLFQVASVTKYFTAALTVNAAAEGKFALTDSVAGLAPGTRLAARAATFDALLSHRSGLGSSYAGEKEFDRDAALAKIDATDFNEADIGSFRYSNDGFDVLGILLEKAYGRPYEDLLREKLFAPACLEHASHWALVDVADPHVVSQPLRDIGDDIRKRNYAMLSSAGLLISARDLALYQRALSEGKVLTPESLATLFAPRVSMSLGQAAYGAFLSERPKAGRVLSARGAEDWGDNAILNHYLDKGVIVAVVTSRGPAEDSGAPFFRNELSQAIETILFGED